MANPSASAIDLNPHDLLEVLQVLNTYQPGVEVRAFGSRVKWTAKPYSDLDLALMTSQPLSLQQEAQLREAFDETTLPFKVDFVDWSTTSETFRKIIQSTSVVLRPAHLVNTDHWQTMTLTEALDALLDYRGKTPEKTTAGIPLITAKIVKNGRIETPTEFIAAEGYDAWMTRGLPKAGDVVLTTEAPLGEVAQLDSARVALAQRIVVLRGKPGVLDNSYLRYLLQSAEMQEQLTARATGTTVLGIKQSELRKIGLRLPPIGHQVAVAKVLSALDDKLELNHRMNDTLEAMARAIFQSWFIVFDPVRAKACGETPESICQRLGLTPELLALFPDDFSQTAVGSIPKGWHLTTLNAMTSKIGSGATPRGGSEVYLDEGISLIRSQNVYDSAFIWDGLARISDEAARQLSNVEVQREDVLINITGASILRTCVVDPQVLPARVNQHVAIIRARNSNAARYLHLHLLQPDTKAYLMGLNAGASREAVTKGHLESVPVIDPGADLLRRFTDTVAPLYAQSEQLLAQARTLQGLRDALLPKLLSGELGAPNLHAVWVDPL